VSISGAPILADGKVTGIATITRDMTATIRARHELTETVGELEAFSYSVAHDLRAPLRAVDGLSRIVLAEHSDGLPEQAQDYLRRIRRAAGNMGELIDDLLTLSRLTRQPMRTEPISMTSLAKRAMAEVASVEDLGDREVVIGDLAPAVGDPGLLLQVFTNLLSNAVKFTRGRAGARIEVGSGRLGQETVYFVRDNGVGFDMRYEDKLFGVFQRLHRADEFEGTGVGLAIARRIVTRHGGRAWAEGRVGEGATFSFTLGEAA
jgi:light-regulated signal transduction histidine kinase (bacteriophytochrome)